MVAERQTDEPLTSDESDAHFACLADAGGIALAVSGGADSRALMRLFAEWRRHRAPSLPVVVLTVDHGLRAESANEARQVSAWAADEELPHETLRWSEAAPAGNIQAAAREARYRLLLQACRRHGLDHLLTAHHLDDQAETFLLRLARGSGVDGLSGMSPSVWRGEVLHVRPLLDVPKARLVATLRAIGQAWIEDPSNASTRFARPRMRALMPTLAAEGLDAERLAATGRSLLRARRALEASARELQDRAAEMHRAGFAMLDVAPLAGAEEEIGLRALGRILMSVGGAALPPRLERLERLYAELRDPAFSGATLAGCELRRTRTGRVLVCREWGRSGLPVAEVPARGAVMWDNRFRIRNDGLRPVTVRALGDGIAADGAGQLPRQALRTMPAAFVEERPVAAPSGPLGGLGPYAEGIVFRFVELDRRPAACDW